MIVPIIEIPKVRQPDFLYYDNSMLDSFRACRRRYLYRHVFYWTPDVISHDLVFGLCWHAAMDVVWGRAKDKTVSDADLEVLAMVAFLDTWFEHYPLEKDNAEQVFASSEDERYPKTPGRAKDMLHHYIRRKRKQLMALDIIGIETPFIVPVPEFDNVFYVGRKDKTARNDMGKVIDYDHKTSKTDGQKWADTFFPSSQMDGYMFSGYLMYGDDYWGVEIDGALVQKGSAKSAREDFPPGIGFMTVPIQRTLGFVESWLWDTTLFIKEIAIHKEMLAQCKPDEEFLRAFPKHTPACGYFKGCEFRPICKFYENPLRFQEPPRGYKVEKWEPFDTLSITKQLLDSIDE